MRAMVYKSPMKMQIEEIDFPKFETNEVLLKVKSVGICGSELHGYLGHDSAITEGSVFGHEFAGEVIKSNSPDFPEGKLVTSNSAISCGNCEFCKSRRDNLCTHRIRLGKSRQGAFAEFISVPVSAIIDLPQNIDPIQASLVEPMATAMHGLRTAKKHLAYPIKNCQVLILGAGSIGLIAGILLKEMGCISITMAEPNASRRETANKQIRCETYNPELSTPGEEKFDYIFDAVGSLETLSTSIKSIKRGGVITLVGLQGKNLILDSQKIIRAGITLMGVANYPSSDLHASVNMIGKGIFKDLSWVQTRTLNEGPMAFNDLLNPQFSFSKIILIP